MKNPQKYNRVAVSILCFLICIGLSGALDDSNITSNISNGKISSNDSMIPTIHGGIPIPPGELEAVGTSSTNFGGCTATLITDNLVLTAAHCVCPSTTNPYGCTKTATFTLRDVFPVDDPNTPNDESQMRKDVSINGKVRVHPEYTWRGWIREDIAVIELDQPASKVAKVKPIDVEYPYKTPLAGDILTLVGYCTGKTKASLPVQASGWGGIKFSNTNMWVCPGDSGGPILDSAQHVVGVASWGGGEDSYYRPTSYSYDWIFDRPQPSWSSCSWIPVEQGGINSHQPNTWCPDGSFITALDLDGDRSLSGHDAPVIGQARCCKLAGAENSKWSSCSWVPVEKAGINSHQPLPSWCPEGSFITAIDLDACGNCLASDSPVIGQVRCCKLSGFEHWGSSYWKGVEKDGINSHQAMDPWCIDGAFITQFDLDGAGNLDDHDAPIVGQAKCSRPLP